MDFWATWCAPCISSFPASNKIVDTHQGDDILFVAITPDSEEKIVQFFEKRKKELRAIKLTDQNSITVKSFHVESYPTTYIFGRPCFSAAGKSKGTGRKKPFCPNERSQHPESEVWPPSRRTTPAHNPCQPQNGCVSSVI